MISFNEYQGYLMQLIGAIGILLSIIVLIVRDYPDIQPVFLVDLCFFLVIIMGLISIIIGLLVVRIVKRKKQALRAKQ